MVNQHQPIYALLRKTLILLFFLSIVPFGIVFFFGEDLFGFVFSEAWSTSGFYSEIMAVWLLFNFVNSPVSSIPMILNRQKEYFFLGLISTVLQLFGFGILPFLLGTDQEDFIHILWFVSISQAVYMIFVTWITLYYAKLGVVKK
jgi:O-antigen/teichoic acid export membrane protein